MEGSISKMNDLHTLYYPLTATPFSSSVLYKEIPPCDALKPFIRCFWGTDNVIVPIQSEASIGNSIEDRESIVTPDTCMDIIININYSDNHSKHSFCGINDITFTGKSQPVTAMTSTFAIRFYAWAVPLFSSDDMSMILNIHCDSEHYFPSLKAKLERMIWNVPELNQRAQIVEQFLLEELNMDAMNHNVMNAIYSMLSHQGNIKMAQVIEYTTVSERQLERLFKIHVGMPPKKLTSLIRYQNVWHDVLHRRDMDSQDIVLKYGYTDQAHLLKDFKRFHSMTMAEAKAYAWRKGR